MQTLDADRAGLTGNAAVSTSQNLKSFTVSAGTLSAVGKSFRCYSGGNFVPVNTTETISFSTNVGSSPSPTLGFTPTSTLTGFRIQEMTSTVVTSGSSGSWGCTERTEVMDGAGVSHVSINAAQPGAELTLAGDYSVYRHALRRITRGKIT